MSFPGDADALAVVDPRRGGGLQRPLFRLSSGALAVWARRGDDLARAGALRTGSCPDELPEDRRRDGLQPSTAAACGARLWARPRRGAGGVAGRARDSDGEWDVPFNSLGRLLE